MLNRLCEFFILWNSHHRISRLSLLTNYKHKIKMLAVSLSIYCRETARYIAKCQFPIYGDLPPCICKSETCQSAIFRGLCLCTTRQFMNCLKSVSLLFQKKDFEKVSFFIVAAYNRELNFFIGIKMLSLYQITSFYYSHQIIKSISYSMSKANTY